MIPQTDETRVEPTTVWIVEQGEYSDYRVVGIFSSEANAQRVADAINAGSNSGASVVQRQMDPAVAELRKGYRQWLLWMLFDGTVERCDQWDVSGYDIAGEVEIWRRSQAPAYRGKGVQDCIKAIVWAKDADHAVKIVNEQRAQFIASGRWKP